MLKRRIKLVSEKFSQSPSSSTDGREHNGEHPSFRNAPETILRMVKRDLFFDQSQNTIQLKHGHGIVGFFWLIRHDWFHTLLRFPTAQSLLSLLACWTLKIMFFVAIYMAVDRRSPEISCGLGSEGNPIEFGGAFAFSLETTTTVGYGLPSGTNAFFENCQGLQVVIYFQMVWSMLFNAFLFAFFYNRIGRSESRALQVVMASKAIVPDIDGQIRFQVRVVDVDSKYPVVEAHIRFYALRKQRPVPKPMRIVDPDDELGAFTLLSFPTVIAHQIDLYSVLHPPGHRKPIDATCLTLRQAEERISFANGYDENPGDWSTIQREYVPSRTVLQVRMFGHIQMELNSDYDNDDSHGDESSYRVTDDNSNSADDESSFATQDDELSFRETDDDSLGDESSDCVADDDSLSDEAHFDGAVETSSYLQELQGITCVDYLCLVGKLNSSNDCTRRCLKTNSQDGVD